jgi:hypothetical protein
MGYLDENFLGDTPQAPMELPQELMETLAQHTAPAPPADVAVPEGWVRLPGNIVIKKTTLIVLGVVIALALVWWYTRKKKK